MESSFNYNSNLVDISVLNSMNANQYPYQTFLMPFYANYLNSKETMKNIPRYDQVIKDHRTPTVENSFEINNHHNDSSKLSLIELLKQKRSNPNHSINQSKKPRSNLEQSIKKQNLNNVLNKIHSFKGANDVNMIKAHSSHNATATIHPIAINVSTAMVEQIIQ